VAVKVNRGFVSQLNERIAGNANPRFSRFELMFPYPVAANVTRMYTFCTFWWGGLALNF
jgi:hypothetical protein